jgi:hypothetical protein
MALPVEAWALLAQEPSNIYRIGERNGEDGFFTSSRLHSAALLVQNGREDRRNKEGRGDPLRCFATRWRIYSADAE